MILANVKKAWLFIHRLDAEKICSIAKRIFAKYAYIKPKVEDGKCIILCHDMPDSPTSWLIDKLLDSKRFMGKYHISNKDREKLLSEDRFWMSICRFGYWDVFDYGRDKDEDGNPVDQPIEKYTLYMLERFRLLRKGHPLHKAMKMASEKTGHSLDNFTDSQMINQKHFCVGNLVDYFGKSDEEATEIVLQEFPAWAKAQPPVSVPKTPEEQHRLNQNLLMKIEQLVKKLAFYSPKMRAKYLNDNDHFTDFILFTTLVMPKGIEWVRQNIGEITGFTD